MEDIDPDCIKILLFNRILKDSAPLKLKLKIWYELELKVRWSKTRLAKLVHSFCNIEVQKFITQDNIDVIMSVMDFLFSKDDRLITQNSQSLDMEKISIEVLRTIAQRLDSQNSITSKFHISSIDLSQAQVQEPNFVELSTPDWPHLQISGIIFPPDLLIRPYFKNLVYVTGRG
jgi:hypothetical protein